jgi:hypothetical protein
MLRGVSAATRALRAWVVAPALALLACSCTPAARLRFVSSSPTQASWAFVLEDRARAAQILIDGRTRDAGCDRQGSRVRCELRGLWPGAHTVDLRLAGARLFRSVMLGRPLPQHPALVRVWDADGARRAAEAGADGVVIAAERADELVDAGHARGLRVIVGGAPDAAVATLERHAADGVLDAAIPDELQRRFPEARALTRLAEPKDAAAAALALLHGGAIVDEHAFPLLRARRRHAALVEGSVRERLTDGRHRALELRAGADAVLLLINQGEQPWQVPTEPLLSTIPHPLDLLGSAPTAGGLVVAPGDAAAVIASPTPDRTRY